MRKNEISAKFEDDIRSALDNGFRPQMSELRGCYSEVYGSQMVFAKGSERIILWMEEEQVEVGERFKKGWVRVNAVHVKAARIKLEKGEKMEWRYCWPKNWETGLYKDEVLYCTSKDRYDEEGWYVESLEHAIECQMKHIERYEYKRDRKSLPMNDKLLRIVRKVNGFKTTPRENIEVEKLLDRNSYIIRNRKSGKVVYVG